MVLDFDRMRWGELGVSPIKTEFFSNSYKWKIYSVKVSMQWDEDSRNIKFKFNI